MRPRVKYPSIAEKLSGMKGLTPESVNMITLALARIGIDCDQVDIYNHEFESLTYTDLVEPPLSLTDTEAWAVAELLPKTQWGSEWLRSGIWSQVVSFTGGSMVTATAVASPKWHNLNAEHIHAMLESSSALAWLL
jgi:hypothetical protein